MCSSPVAGILIFRNILMIMGRSIRITTQLSHIIRAVITMGVFNMGLVTMIREIIIIVINIVNMRVIIIIMVNISIIVISIITIYVFLKSIIIIGRYYLLCLFS